MAFVDYVSESMPKKAKYPELERQAGNPLMVNYQIGDFLIRIKNTVLAGKKEVETTNIKVVKACALALKKAGFLEDVKVDGKKLIAKVAFRNKKPVIFNIKLISKPGLRIYQDVSEIRSKKGPSVLVLSTSKGILTSPEALKKMVGGEVIAEIW